MGEIAEMMMDGTLCEGCGEFIGNAGAGYARYCSPQCANDRGAPACTAAKQQTQHGPLRRKDRNWLSMIAAGQGGMPGWPCDFIPKAPANRLLKRGLITIYMPHNSAHKDRWTITPAGQAALDTP